MNKFLVVGLLLITTIARAEGFYTEEFRFDFVSCDMGPFSSPVQCDLAPVRLSIPEVSSNAPRSRAWSPIAKEDGSPSNLCVAMIIVAARPGEREGFNHYNFAIAENSRQGCYYGKTIYESSFTAKSKAIEQIEFNDNRKFQLLITQQ